MKLGKILRLIRNSKDMTQKEMAYHVKISPNYLSLIENNNRMPSLERLNSFAKIFNVSKDALLFISLSPPEELTEDDKKIFVEIQKNIIKYFILLI